MQPGIQVVKLTNGTDNANANIAAGSTVTWTYNVTNTGNVALSGVTVRDSDPAVHPAVPSGDTNGDGLLELGETWVFTATGTAVAGQYYEHRHGQRRGRHGHSLRVLSRPAKATGYFGVQPGIHVVKLTNGTDNNTAPAAQVTAGSTVTWTYDVTTTGTVPLKQP